MIEFLEVKDDTLYTEEIYNILKECGEHMYNQNKLTHWLTPYSIENIKSDIKNKRVFVAKSGNGVVATFMLDKNKTRFFSDDEPFIYWSKLGVKPNKSKLGIGKQCLDYIESIVSSNGFIGLRMDVYDKSENSLRFFINNGFKEVGKARTKNFGVICMEKRMK